MGLQHEIKHRVTFTKNIKRILESLKMIAAMRSKKMAVEYKHANQFKTTLEKTYLTTLHSNIEAQDTLYVFIGANKGLCGSFVINLNIMLKNKFPKIEQQKNAKWIIIGNKLPSYLSKISENNILMKTDMLNKTSDYMKISELIYAERQNFKKIIILGWKMLENEPKESIIFDLNPSEENLDIDNIKTATINTVILNDYSSELSTEYEKRLSLLYIFGEINLAITQSIAREEKTRLLAMDQAITNSDEMLLKLQRQFNQVRQASITNEINEIISGAEFA